MFRLSLMVTVTFLVLGNACTAESDDRLDARDVVTSDDGTEDVDEQDQDEVLQIPDTGACLGASIGGACAPSGRTCGTHDECCCGLCAASQTCMCENGRFVCGAYADRCLRPECSE